MSTSNISNKLDSLIEKTEINIEEDKKDIYIISKNVSSLVDKSNRLLHILTESVGNKTLYGEYFLQCFGKYLKQDVKDQVNNKTEIRFMTVMELPSFDLSLNFVNNLTGVVILNLKLINQKILDDLFVGTGTEYILIDGKLKKRIVSERGVELIGTV